MNTKLLQVIDKMLDSEDAIISIERAKDEYYFEFPAFVYWSIKSWHDTETNERIHSLYFYPKAEGGLKDVVETEWGVPWIDNQFISYNTRDFKDEDFKDKLIRLESMIKSKYFGVNDIFDRIINEQ